MTAPRIMVVEDEFLIAIRIEALLARAGIEVVGPVGTVEEGLSLAGETPLDGAVLDVNLRGQRVDPVASVLIARNVPFLFVSGYERDVLPPAFREAVMISKPFRDGDLLKALSQLVPS
jgi:two-component SAPR family response regulator